MISDVETSSPENRFPGRLTRRISFFLLPTILLPGSIAILDLIFFSKLPNNMRIGGILLTCLLLGLIILITLNQYIKRQIIKPIQKLIETVRRFSLGDLKQRTQIDRRDEIGLLAYFIDKVGDVIHNRLFGLEVEINEKALQLRITSEFSRILASIDNQEKLFQETVDLIADRFKDKSATIFLLNRKKNQDVLKAVSIQPGDNQENEDTFPVDAIPTIQWAINNNQTKNFTQPELEDLKLPTFKSTLAKSAIAIPISSMGRVMGIVLVQDRKIEAFRDEDITLLNSIANQLAATIKNQISYEPSSTFFSEDSFLYNASHTIITADTEEQVFNALKNILKQMSFASALFITEQKKLTSLFVTDQSGLELPSNSVDDINIPRHFTSSLTLYSSPFSVNQLEEMEGIPEPLVVVCQNLRFDSLKLYPILVDEQLEGLLFLGATELVHFSTINLELIQRLVDITVSALKRIFVFQRLTNHLTELHILNAVSQSISSENNLDTLYKVVNEQIVNVMGPVNFLIALYTEATNTIEIPYMDNGNRIVKLPPYPLGQDLTSIIIRTRQPLMIVEDAINRSQALGAIITDDKPALSWLGVPMVLHNEILGAIVVQDLEQENRFDENDIRLLSTLAPQIAIAIRNTRLIETSQKHAIRDRQLYEITNEIRRQVDTQGVISTTAQELSKVFKVRSTRIVITPNAFTQGFKGNGRNEEEIQSL